MDQTITLPVTATSTANGMEWHNAIELWLSSRNSPATRRAYATALQDLLASTGRLPWEVTRTDVIRWMGGLKERGLAPATAGSRLAGVRSFYRFVMEDYLVTAADGSQGPLHAANPAVGKSLRPKVELYGKAVWLSPDETKALLRAIGRGDVRARRNYALFLGYIFLARRNSEWRLARWGNFERHGNQVQFRWSGKGKVEQRLEIPAPVWSAVVEYLEAAGRMGTITVGDYLFTPLNESIRLPNGSALGTTQPLSAHEVGRILKRYCKLAGLEQSVHPHTLRHTGAMLRKEVGDTPEEIQRWLGHARLDTTLIYLHKLEGKADQSWGRVADLLGMPSDEEGYTKEPKKGKNRPLIPSYRSKEGQK